MVVEEAVIVAGIGSRKGVGAAEVRQALAAALAAHGLEPSAVAALATTPFKKDEAGIFEAGKAMGIPVRIVEPASASHEPIERKMRASEVEVPPPLTPPHKGEGAAVSESPSSLWGGVRGGGTSAIAEMDTAVDIRPDRQKPLTRSALSLSLAGAPSVSESAALAAAGPGARLLGPRIATGRVTCALAESRP
jgi:cobalamin biosynthesis protein CbiG